MGSKRDEAVLSCLPRFDWEPRKRTSRLKLGLSILALSGCETGVTTNVNWVSHKQKLVRWFMRQQIAITWMFEVAQPRAGHTTCNVVWVGGWTVGYITRPSPTLSSLASSILVSSLLFSPPYTYDFLTFLPDSSHFFFLIFCSPLFAPLQLCSLLLSFHLTSLLFSLSRVILIHSPVLLSSTPLPVPSLVLYNSFFSYTPLSSIIIN